MDVTHGAETFDPGDENWVGINFRVCFSHVKVALLNATERQSISGVVPEHATTAEEDATFGHEGVYTNWILTRAIRRRFEEF